MIIRSPFFYVGDKYKLMGQLVELFPPNIETYLDAFAGGGSSFLNVGAKKYLVNDIDKNLIALHKELSSYANKRDELFILTTSGLSVLWASLGTLIQGINLKIRATKQSIYQIIFQVFLG